MSTSEQAPTAAAIWARVSTTEQHAANQLDVLRAEAAKRGLDVVAEFVTEDSAWQASNGKGKGAEFDRQRRALLDGAHRGQYQVVLIWALDRLSRKGIADTGNVVRQLTAAGCEIWSHQESWMQTTDPHTRELIIAIMAWLAEMESARRSERIKAGLARRRAEGLPVGRQAGAADKRRRRRSGYVAAWETGGARREAQQHQPPD
jgi:DNA invertase Pin-like site-specific DNA recombinase